MKNSTTKTAASLFFLFFTMVVFSQTASEKQANLLKEDAFKTFDSNEVIGNGQITALRDKGFTVKGTTYFIEELYDGKLKTFKNDEYREGLQLRYDIFFNRLEVLAQEVHFVAVNEQISEFIIDDGSSVFHFYNSSRVGGDFKTLGYVRIVEKGDKFSIFANDQKIKKVKESRGAYASSGDTNVVELIDVADYYIYDETAKELIETKSKKKLMERFPTLKDFGKISSKDLKRERFIRNIVSFLAASN